MSHALKQGVIYKITNPVGRIYVGKTINFKNRMSCYKNSTHISSQKIIYNSIMKYGWKNHKVEILCECDINNLNNMEINYIKEENSYRHLNAMGMNLTLGGDGCFGRIDSDETKRKRSEKHIGTKRSDETKKLMSEIKRGIIPEASFLPRSEKQLHHIKYGNIGRIKKDSSSKQEKETKFNKFIENHESILQYHINGELVKEWKTLPMDVAKTNKIDSSTFYKMLNNKNKTCNGYVWRYKK